MNKQRMLQLGGLLGLIGVALGAFGAHALKDSLVSSGLLETWKTATVYQLVHAVAMTTTPARTGGRFPPALFFAVGIVLFSGSLFIMALTGITKLGIITPFGGLFFLGGWIRLILCAGHTEHD